MTDEEKLAALEAEKLALEQKISAINIIKEFENTKSDYVCLTVWSAPNILGNKYLYFKASVPPALRFALAKVFRDFYGIKETQDDN